MSRGSGYVEVWEEGGTWHWMFRDPREGVVLLGNRTYPTRERTVAAARTAYRDVPIREPSVPREHLAARTVVATALGALGAGAVLRLRRRSDGADPMDCGDRPASGGSARRPGRSSRDS